MGDDGRRWFEQPKGFVARARPAGADDTPELWTRCSGCGETLFKDSLAQAARVCPACGHHFRLGARERLELLCDEGTVEEYDEGLTSEDPLAFVDSKPYTRRLDAAQRKTGRDEAFVSAAAQIGGLPVEIGAFEFAFMGGSMGSVVGEAITRLFERATARKVPAIVISASGGRPHAGGRPLAHADGQDLCRPRPPQGRGPDCPYISVLTHPTTGGVAASFSMLGDLILAEPGALVGFAGPRVIKETIGQDLPEGFQTAEYLLEHGMIDRIVSRDQLRPTLRRLLGQLLDPLIDSSAAS